MLNLHKYHSTNLENIKSVIGASYVAYERYQDKYALKVIKNKESRWFKLEGHPDDVTPKRYGELKTQLKQTYGIL